MDKIPFQDGTKIKNATVTVNEQEYEVIPAQYQGTTPMSAFNLNKMQDNIENAINKSVIKETNINGTAIKFTDGTMICYNVQTFSAVAGGNPLGNLYRTNTLTLSNFPIQFISVPSVTYSIQKASEVGWIAILTSAEYQATNVRPARPVLVKATNAEVDSITIEYIAIGKWK